jgi:hypothetical protein
MTIDFDEMNRLVEQRRLRAEQLESEEAIYANDPEGKIIEMCNLMCNALEDFDGRELSDGRIVDISTPGDMYSGSMGATNGAGQRSILIYWSGYIENATVHININIMHSAGYSQAQYNYTQLKHLRLFIRGILPEALIQYL